MEAVGGDVTRIARTLGCKDPSKDDRAMSALRMVCLNICWFPASFTVTILAAGWQQECWSDFSFARLYKVDRVRFSALTLILTVADSTHQQPRLVLAHFYIKIQTRNQGSFNPSSSRRHSCH